jgi:hypothetical protein
VHGVIADSAGGAWTFGGSILTFAFPMILFIVVACALYVLYTKPEVVPGHRVRPPERPVSYTAVPGAASAAGPGPGQAVLTETDASPAAEADADPLAGTSAAGTSAAGTSAGETSVGEATRTEDAE